MHTKLFSATTLGTAAALLTSAAAHAAVVAPFSITTDPGTGSATDNENLIGITLVEDGPTLSTILPATYVGGDSGTTIQANDVGTPAQNAATIAAFQSDASISTGTLSTSANTQWTFGESVGLDEIIYVAELAAGTSNDDPVFELIDSSNVALGFTLSISGFGADPTGLTSITTTRSTGALAGGSIAVQTFTAADFTDGSGASYAGTAAWGIQLTTPDGIDITAVGRAVPEPGSLMLIGLGGVVMLRRRRA
ncbi:MAG: PEP-CTERM sorting domain-containing protein [Planctomycetota bacterium]